MITSSAQLVQQAKQQIKNLSVEEIVDGLAKGAFTLIDIREAAETQNGMIAGAVNAPRGMLEFYADPSSPYHLTSFNPDTPIVLHCASGGRSALAVKTLQDMGYTNVAHLDGGFKAWQSAGQPVVKPE